MLLRCNRVGPRSGTDDSIRVSDEQQVECLIDCVGWEEMNVSHVNLPGFVLEHRHLRKLRQRFALVLRTQQIVAFICSRAQQQWQQQAGIQSARTDLPLGSATSFAFDVLPVLHRTVVDFEIAGAIVQAEDESRKQG